MTRPLAPNIPTATAHNRYLVLGSETGPIEVNRRCPVGSPASQEVADDLAVKQGFAHVVGPRDEFVLPDTSYAPTSWSDLTTWMHKGVVRHLNSRDFTPYTSLPPFTRESEDRRKGNKVSLEGIATMSAFMRVVAEVAPPTPQKQRNERMATIARRSRGFIVSWSAIHASYDEALARALAGVSQKAPNPFESLRFDPKWFVYTEDHVMLDPQRYPALGQSLKQRVASTYISYPPAAVFGCPAARIIPIMYGAMVDAAERGQLFDQ